MKYYDKLKKIEELTRACTDSNARELHLLIKDDEALETEVFKMLKTLGWFSNLKNNGNLSAEGIKYDNLGTAIFWSPLYYLESISIQLKESPVENKAYATELIHIIGDIFKVSKERFDKVGKPINHMHIWWYCIKILNNIPNDIIKKDLPLNTFKVWLGELSNIREANDLAMHEISEKLLGKFIDDETTISYAEAIIDVITGLRENPKPRKLLGDRDALLVMDSYWLMEAFKNRSEIIASRCSQDAIYGLADKLKCALEYERRESRVIIYIETKCYQIKLERVPCEGRMDIRVCFEPARYECVVGQYSKGQLDAAQNKGGDFALYYEAPEKELTRYPIAGETFDDVRAVVEQGLPEKIKWHKAEAFTDKLRSLYGGLFEDYSHIWFKHLAGKSMRANLDAKETQVSIFRDVLLARCKSHRIETKEVLTALLSEQYRFPLFKRCALLCISEYWNDYSDLFQRFIDQEGNVLRKSEWEIELYDLLQKHCMELSDRYKRRLKELIDDVPDYYKEKETRFAARWKWEWLSPLKESPDFVDLYKEVEKQAGLEKEEPYEPERTSPRVGAYEHRSPLTIEEVLAKDIPDLVKYLQEFKGADDWGQLEGNPDIDGLANTLQSAVLANPKKYVESIEEFIDVPYPYICRIMRGLNDAWKEKKPLDWSAIFEFSLKYLSKKNFREEALAGQGEDSGGGRYIWFIDALADLIESGSRADDHAFPPDLFPKADEIFNAVYPFLKGEENPDTQRDALTYSLNTTLGRTVQAFIIYSLRLKRIDKKERTDRCANWGAGKYELYLSKGIEPYVWFGRYLPHVRFIDKEYVENKIKELAEWPSNNRDWRVFMEGYLSGAYVYDEVYALMRSHYKNAIENVVFDENIDKRLVEHITIGYLRGHESLKDDSLFRVMLDGANTPEKRKRWLDASGYLWSISPRTMKEKYEDSAKQKIAIETKQKVIDFWKWTYDEQKNIEKLLSEDYLNFLGRMADLTIYLDKLDGDSGEWLMLAAPHAERHHMSSFLIEYLTYFEDDESLRWIGKIFIKMLENFTPTYEKENIECIVRRLYELGKKEPEVKENADTICNTYGRRGEHFLRGLYDEYNP